MAQATWAARSSPGFPDFLTGKELGAGTKIVGQNAVCAKVALCDLCDGFWPDDLDRRAALIPDRVNEQCIVHNVIRVEVA